MKCIGHRARHNVGKEGGRGEWLPMSSGAGPKRPPTGGGGWQGRRDMLHAACTAPALRRRALHRRLRCLRWLVRWLQLAQGTPRSTSLHEAPCPNMPSFPPPVDPLLAAGGRQVFALSAPGGGVLGTRKRPLTKWITLCSPGMPRLG